MRIGVVVRDALLVLALAPFAYYLLAILAALRFFSARRKLAANQDFTPSISILKPVRGLDNEAYESYASLCGQNYPEFEVLFGVSDANDPAIPEIERVIRDFPSRPIRLLIGSERVGASDKVNNLCRLAREARHHILLVSDSDVRVGPGFLRAIVSEFRDPAVGGVTCLYRGMASGFAATLEALGDSGAFAPGVLVARLFGDIDFMLGAVMAVTAPQLASIGGFESLADYFSDDYELGSRIAAGGKRVILSRYPVSIVYPRETLGQAFRHQLRWNLSIRYSRPWGHFGLLFSHGLVWAILGAALAPSAAIVGAYLGAYLVLRCAMALAVGVMGMDDETTRRWWRLLPLRDALAFAVWIASFFP
ncbi:MAG: glycosyltransferase, partial [Acidobacteriota bacterium]|nr:glycosyltransferase [Acidobacteriota bacterium]